MQELLQSLGTENLGILMGLATIGTIVITVVALVQWRKLRQTQLEISLKQDMIARGMSAEEINRVMQAGHVEFEPFKYGLKQQQGPGQAPQATEASPQTTPASAMKQTASYHAHA